MLFRSGGHRSGGAGGDLEQLGFALTENTYRGGSREEEEAAWGLCAVEQWMGMPSGTHLLEGVAELDRQAAACLPASSSLPTVKGGRQENPLEVLVNCREVPAERKRAETRRYKDLFGGFWKQEGYIWKAQRICDETMCLFAIFGKVCNAKHWLQD